jgi:hypothetical protein
VYNILRLNAPTRIARSESDLEYVAQYYTFGFLSFPSTKAMSSAIADLVWAMIGIESVLEEVFRRSKGHFIYLSVESRLGT